MTSCSYTDQGIKDHLSSGLVDHPLHPKYFFGLDCIIQLVSTSSMIVKRKRQKRVHVKARLQQDMQQLKIKKEKKKEGILQFTLLKNKASQIKLTNAREQIYDQEKGSVNLLNHKYH